MQISKFDIRNYKGIEHTEVRLVDETPGNISMLIGLNESGKTTILEALSGFVSEDADTASLVQTVFRKSSFQDLIPKDRKAAFTGNISVRATSQLEDADIPVISRYLLSEHKLILDVASLTKSFPIERYYSFEDSTYKRPGITWGLLFQAKNSGSKKLQKFDGGEENAERRKIWLGVVAALREKLPKIVYFPTFLFDFPDRIYLVKENDETNSYYVQVVQDVLDSQGDGLSVQKHIVDRIARLQEAHPTVATFLGFLFGQDEKKQIDAVLQKASNEMSKVIFGSWNQILGKHLDNKRVQVDWFLDSEKQNAPYLEVSIVDGQSKFSLSERSLGFRWFFSFLLFTQFRRNRKSHGSTLFLFDEPAANLHSKAQMKLLESFERIARDSTFIIYSTDSHYMVNPLWLEKAYIIENAATNYDHEEELESFTFRKTDIKARRYKTFVGQHPGKTTYFQPALDALEVSFSPMIRSSNALIVEGKYDYYSLRYLRRNKTTSTPLDIFPGNGADHLAVLISLFRGWGINFRVLLDDDKAGRDAKQRYLKDILLSDAEVITLGQIDGSLSGKAFEHLYKDDVRNAVKDAYSVSAPTKRQFALHFQHLLSTKSDQNYAETEAAFAPISAWLDAEFH